MNPTRNGLAPSSLIDLRRMPEPRPNIAAVIKKVLTASIESRKPFEKILADPIAAATTNPIIKIQQQET